MVNELVLLRCGQPDVVMNWSVTRTTTPATMHVAWSNSSSQDCAPGSERREVLAAAFSPDLTRWSEYIRCISGIDASLPASDWATDLRSRLDGLLDEYRTALHASLDGLTEDEARLRLVPSKTTLLGLVKHVTYVEGVWFDQAINGRSYPEIGIPNSADLSFMVRASDTITSVQDDHRLRCAASRRAMADLSSTQSCTAAETVRCGHCCCRCYVN